MSKKLIFVVVAALVLSLASFTWADLILHYSLDEGSGMTAFDQSGNGRDGTFEGSPEWVGGKIGTGVELGGDGDRIVDEDGEDYLNGLEALTIALWVKANSIPTDAGFIQGEDPDGGDNVCTIRYDASGASFGGSSLLKMAVTSDQGGEQQLESSNNAQTTEWQHVAMTWESGGLIRLYLDGEEDEPAGRNGPNNAGVVSGCDKFIVGQGAKDSGGGWDGLVDDVRIYDTAMSAEQIQGVMKGEGFPFAFGPDPADGALHEDTWVNLSWKPGDFAVSHDVYLGDNLDEVSNATPDSDAFQGNQTTTFYVAGFPGFAFPEGLVPGTTYYWRIDEVNEADPNSPWKGPVWSFSIPPKTAYNPDPADGTEIADIDNPRLSWTAGFGAKLHTVYFGDDYDTVDNATTGTPSGMTTYNPGPLQGEKVYYWRVDEFDAIETHKGEVWTFTTPGAVGAPVPALGATGVAMTTSLSWRAATNATSHDVYLGLDKETVRNADTSSPEYQGNVALDSESVDPGKLAWLTMYYWRVDAVTSTGPIKGPIWSFTTADFISVDDFESYTDDDVAGEAIWQSWIDGFGVADNGAQVGYLLPPYAEQSIVHSGAQSMPLIYTNEAGVTNSEGVLTLTQARDWTEENVAELKLWVRGSSVNAAEPLYVSVANAAGTPAIIANEDPVIAQKGSWTQWVIPLQAFADQGINLVNVDKIALGLGSTSGMAAVGGTGTMFVDDIALFRSEP